MTSDSGYRWQLPQQFDHDKHQIRVFNSFTRKKELFVSKKGKSIKWYSCGPTVYDVAHLGHARCYITFDIIRRLLADYFGYHVFYIMNITDIDDKIIKRARTNHLFDKFIDSYFNSQDKTFSCENHELINYLKTALKNYQNRRKQEKDESKLEMIRNVIKVSQSNIQLLESILDNQKLPHLSISSSAHVRKILEDLKDVISDEQDDSLGHTITDHLIFKALTEQYEQEFHHDMNALGVMPPSALTRVSDFIDEIAAFIQRLQENGFAYQVPEGSIYFDTNKFDSDSKHSYAKLVREAYGSNRNLDEGEGELSLVGEGKKSPNDFALWKKSKQGEPSWEKSNLAKGRPGWHIECSVMATHHLGENFDIHSGGCDLKFPHHDNEIAQAEAYFNTGKNWLNYFLHSGHLTISGCKMSKSLKNFITIRKALESYTSRQLRFAFLAHGWTETLDYSENTMNIARSFERSIKEFFLNVSDYLRSRLSLIEKDGNGTGSRLCKIYQKWSEDDHSLNKVFLETTVMVDRALCDNFDTRSALNHMTNLIKEYNKRSQSDVLLVKDIASYVHRMMNIFGATFAEFNPDQFSLISQSQKLSKSTKDNTDAYEYVKALADFRAKIRMLCKSSDATKSIKDILSLCDKLRDSDLPELGVLLEDKEVDGCPFVVKFVDSESLARERAQREEAKRIKEETAKLASMKLNEEREKKMKISPKEMFTHQLDKFSKFDHLGMPTHDAAGKEISKSALKKLQRLYAEQEARYNKYQSSLQS